MVDLAPIPVVASPREHLSSHQIGLVRQLVEHGPAIKVRGGWMLGDRFHRERTFRPLIAKDLANATFRWGKHRLEANHNARAMIERLDFTRHRAVLSPH